MLPSTGAPDSSVIGSTDDAGDGLDPRQLGRLVHVVGDDLHRAVAAVAQGLGDGDHLVGAGVGAGHDLALLVAVAVEARRREPERPIGQRAPAELGHAGDVVGGGVVVAAVAHHVVAQGDVGDLGADVDAVGRVDGVEVVAERLPTPRDAFVQRGPGDVLDGLHEGDELALRARPHRREPDAAVAHHDRRDAVPRRRRDLLVPADLAVEVGVDVDEARRHQRAVGVDGAAGGALDVTDGRDHAVTDRDVGRPAGRTGPVDHVPVADVQIVHDASSVSIATLRPHRPPLRALRPSRPGDPLGDEGVGRRLVADLVARAQGAERCVPERRVQPVAVPRSDVDVRLGGRRVAGGEADVDPQAAAVPRS